MTGPETDPAGASPALTLAPATAAGTERILDALRDHAVAVGLPFDEVDLMIEARHGDAWLGALQMRLNQGWLYVTLLAVAEDARGRGIGGALMARAEEEARARGLVGLWLDTYTFQAPAFYAGLGFEEVGRIPDYPPGHARVFLAKRLDGRPVGDAPG